MEEINLHEHEQQGGSVGNGTLNGRSANENLGSENGAPVFADDGRVHKVFFSTLTPNQEVCSMLKYPDFGVALVV